VLIGRAECFRSGAVAGLPGGVGQEFLMALLAIGTWHAYELRARLTLALGWLEG
jgi:hypothetical protein